MAVYTGPQYGIGWRHLLVLLAFFAFLVTYMLRVNMNVAIVAMINQTALDLENKVTQHAAYCLIKDNANMSNATAAPETHEYVEGPYVWSTDEQGFILGAFYYGYTVTQLPGGWIAGRFGAKWVMGIALLLTSVLSIITPFAAMAGFETVIAVRVLEGMFQGVLFPAMHDMLGKWVPPLERSKLPAFVYAGYYVGTVTAFAGSGYLAASSIGWESIFYVTGAIGCIWFVFWFFFVSNSPENHKWISKAERSFIVDSIAAEKSIKTHGPTACSDIPWLSFAKSLPFIALCVSQTCHTWSFYTVLTDLPIYLRTILGFNIQTNGLISSAPYLVAFFFQLATSSLADLIRSKGWLSTTWVRKLFDCSGNFLQGVLMLSLTFVGCHRTPVVVLLCFATAVGTFNSSGYVVNHLDLAPIHAGMLMGVSNSVSNVAGFITPVVVGKLTDGNQTLSAWNKVFYIATAVDWFGTLFYLIFASGELQPWAKERQNKEPSEIAIGPAEPNSDKSKTDTIELSDKSDKF